MREQPQPLAITELGLDFPEPELAFSNMVRAELADARRRARKCLRHRARRTYRSVPGHCAECGTPHDRHTKGCTRCDARHYMRARNGHPASDRSSSLLDVEDTWKAWAKLPCSCMGETNEDGLMFIVAEGFLCEAGHKQGDLVEVREGLAQ